MCWFGISGAQARNANQLIPPPRDKSRQSVAAFAARCCRRGSIRKGSNRVNRGGSWNNNARNCRVSNRDGALTNFGLLVYGLRLVL